MTRVPFPKRRNVRRRNNFLDNNALECAEIDRIFQIGETQSNVLIVAHTVLAELAHPNTPNEVRARGYRSLFSIAVPTTRAEGELLARIATILTGNSQDSRHVADANHVFTAGKYGGTFITEDRRIRQRASEIEDICNVTILTPGEWLEAYDQDD